MTENNTENINQAEETVLQTSTEIVETQSEVDALDITATEENQKGEKPQSGEKAFWKDLIQTIVMAVVIFLVLNTFTSRVKVFNVSMQPTLKQGYLIVVSKMAYKFGSPKRGDIIVFHHAGVEDQDYIKRVIGLPGDVVEISGGVVSINGTPLTEPYIKEMPRYTLTETVPEGKLFVLGDNRNQS
ncbi:MAG TPA: signal peptidase I, partial [Anaerolineaceae bacterium]|nr:signal peptidase I [Anaerolineaceae bacterium]